MQNPNYDPNTLSTFIDVLNEGKIKGTGIYSTVLNDLLSFVQEDQSVRSGTPTVTETSAQTALVTPLHVPGGVEAIREFLIHNLETAESEQNHDRQVNQRREGREEEAPASDELDVTVNVLAVGSIE